MATGTTQQLESMPDAMRPSDDLIEEHIARTRGYVAACDVAGSLVTLFAFGLGYLLLMAVADHWLFFGGMGGWGRAVAWLVLVLAGCGYAAWTLVPFCLRKISPLYAAAALEKAQPTLKNSLVNFILLKGHRAGTADAVFRGLSLQTAAGLVDLPVEAAVDRRRLLRASYVLIGLLVLAAGYLVISPKNPLTAAARVLVPWADIAASTRVRIEKIQPGDGDAYRGEPLTVSAEVRGLRDREPVTLHFSTVDGQVEDQTVVMYPKEGELVYSCQLPPESGGMQRDLVYTIRAGDARSRPFHIRVIPAPVIQIAKIEYRYPEYTRMPPQVVERLGDIKAIEGTSVVIHAQASQPIQTASIELSGARSQARSMETRGELAARVALPLRLVRNRSGFEPEFNSYRLRVTNERGDRNRDTVSYRIEVTPDLGPQVEILAPQERELKLPADGELPIEVRGRDADFELSDLRVQAKCGDRKVCDEPLLDRKRDPLPWNKTYRLEMRFRPAKYQLKPGDVVQLRAIALDNKTPQPNRAETGEYRIVITEPENPPGEKGEKGENGAKGEKGDAQGDKSDKGMKGGKNDKGEKGDKGQNDKSGKGEDQKGDGDSKDSKSEKDSKGEKGSKGGRGQGGSGSKKDSKDQKGKSDSGEGGGGGESGDDKADQKSDPKQGEKSKGAKGSSGGTSGEKGDKSDGKSDGKSDDMSDGKSDDMSGDSSSGGNPGSSKGNRGSKSGKSQQDDQLAQRDQEPSEPAQSDGDAVQDILDHRKEKEGKTPQDNAGDKQPAGEKPSQRGDKQQAGEQGDKSQGEKSEKGEKGAKGMTQQGHGDKGEGDMNSMGEKGEKGAAEKGAGEKSQGEKSQGEKKPGGKGAGEKGEKGEKGQGEKGEKSEKGMGERGMGEKGVGEKNPSKKNPAEKNPAEKNPTDNKSGGAMGHPQDEMSPQGMSEGMGQKGDQQRAGSEQAGQKPTGGQPSKPQDHQSQPNQTGGKDTPPSDASSKEADTPNKQNQRPSSAQSGQGGEKGGKGPQGSGQQQSGAGQGSAGNNQSADEGANRSMEQGMGEQSGKAGMQQQSNMATGQAGQKPGDASDGKPKPGESPQQKPGQPPQQQQPNSPRDANSPPGADAQPGMGQQDGMGQKSSAPGNMPGGAVDPKRNAAPPPGGQGDDRGPGAAAANTKYAQQATDFVLEYLQDQMEKGEIDPALKRRLGWTDQQVRDLARRLEAQRDRGAREGANPADRKAHEEWLRSLGLRPSGGAVKTGRGQTKELDHARDDSSVTVPRALREQHEAFRRGVLEGAAGGE